MVAVNVVAADDDATARQLFTSLQQSFTNVFRGARGQLPPPVEDIEAYWSPEEKARVSQMLNRSYVGAAHTVREGLGQLIDETQADELIVASAIYDHPARVRSYQILESVMQALPLSRSVLPGG
jgi:alkanesulfonate monooxygenase SsuD/methylene tetrahydromethanopterin reductase-like flavin-dependent oxidoreductase (luciferase family)